MTAITQNPELDSIRHEALQLAAHTRQDGEPTKNTIERAQAFYEFLTGTEKATQR